jgi:hypothetical protein
MALRGERVAIAHMPRMSALAAPARDRTRTHKRTRVPSYMPGLCTDRYLYIFIHDVCAGHIHRRTYPRAQAMAPAASSARAIARTRAWEAVQPHARPYPSLTQVCIYLSVYLYCMHTCTYIHKNTYNHISRLSYTQRSYTYTRGRPRMRVPTRLRTHTRARIGGAAVHNGPRRTDDPPRLSRLRWRAARAGKAAHTLANEVTDAVFHAPMFALNADISLNACEPSHTRSTPTERAPTCRREFPIAHAHARALGRSTWARLCGGPAPATRSSG